MSAPLFPLDPSLWFATARPAPVHPPLDGDATTDVVIVGAGFAGTTAALELATAGVRVMLLEAREPGWGGSGRNGGQVIPGLKYDPDEMEAKFGIEAGRALTTFAGSTADAVFDRIARHDLAVPHVREGWIQGAHDAASIATVARRCAQWQKRGVTGAHVLDRAQVTEAIGSSAYFGGWLDPRGGAVQPLDYVRELARAAVAAGATLHGSTPVSDVVRRGNAWHVVTANGGSVRAEKVLICTNAYTGAFLPPAGRTVVTPNSYQVATEPLPPDVAASILKGGRVSSDTRRLLHYFRLDHTGRLMMGGRGPSRQPTSASDWSHLERAARRMFPQIGEARIDYRWCGHVSVTPDHLPHLHEPEPGLVVNIGCQGRGVGLETAMGAALARYVTSGDARALPFPILPMRPIPFHFLQQVYVAAAVAWFRFLDAASA